MIIICDDDRHIAEMLCEILSDKYECKTYGSPIDLLKDVRNQKPDLFIIDRVLPGMSGDELVEKLIYKYERVPFLIISGMYPVNIKIEKAPLSQIYFINKPFDGKKIKRFVDAILDDPVDQNELRQTYDQKA